jgi:hypothetical protein
MSQSRQQCMQLFMHEIEGIDYNVIIHIRNQILVLFPKFQTCQGKLSTYILRI